MVEVRVQLVGEDIKWLVQRGGGALLRLWLRRSGAPKFARTGLPPQAPPHIHQRLSSFGRNSEFVRVVGWLS